MNSWNILFVDDDTGILSAIRRMMIGSPYQCFFCESGTAGLEIIKNENIHLVVSDHQMPTMNGSEFLHRARLYNDRIVRCLLSGYTDMATLLEAINRGEVYRFIPKPWTEDQFFQIVRECLAEYQNNFGDTLMKKVASDMDVPFVVGIMASSDFTWMNQAATTLLLQPGVAIPADEWLGTAASSLPWPFKDFFPDETVELRTFLESREFICRGRPGHFHEVAVSGFPDSVYTGFLWKEDKASK